MDDRDAAALCALLRLSICLWASARRLDGRRLLLARRGRPRRLAHQLNR